MIEKSAYTHEELAEDLKSTVKVVDPTPIPATQDGTLPSQMVDVDTTKSSGIDGDAGNWTQAGQLADGWPVAKGSEGDTTAPAPTEKLEAPEKSDDDKKAASIDQDLHPEKYEEA
jgi:hypothetical protein